MSQILNFKLRFRQTPQCVHLLNRHSFSNNIHKYIHNFYFEFNECVDENGYYVKYLIVNITLININKIPFLTIIKRQIMEDLMDRIYEKNIYKKLNCSNMWYYACFYDK
jgi:hypothetical protein